MLTEPAHAPDQLQGHGGVQLGVREPVAHRRGVEAVIEQLRGDEHRIPIACLGTVTRRAAVTAGGPGVAATRSRSAE
jgi:hypothetical protein